MPRFEPFEGLRYRAPPLDLDDVIAPPYDVISPSEQATLQRRHPLNAVHVEYPEPEPSLDLDEYEAAAFRLADWIERGQLVADARPGFYVYRMTPPEGPASTGVIGALALPPRRRPGGGSPDDVLPHEETLPKPKGDRYDLLAATRANLSPIWGLSMATGLSAAFGPLRTPTAAATDDEGVRHQLWVVDDPAVVAEIGGTVASAPVVIADGHHRFETARLYLEDHPEGSRERVGADLIMALVTELTPDQLRVEAIHRTLEGLPDDLDLPLVFRRWFDLVRAGPSDGPGSEAVLGSGDLILATPDSAWLMTPRPEALEAADSDLDSSLVALALAGLPAHEVVPRHDRRQAIETLRRGEAQAALLLRPVTVAQISSWADRRRRMPPKTTYFTPKPRTGMVYRLLDR